MAADSRLKQKLQMDNSQDEKLPPVDGGAAAWRFVIGVYFLEGLLWGFPLTFGVFQAYYGKHELFQANEKQIPVIGATIMGIAHAGFPIVSPIALRYHKYQLHMVWFGWALCIFSVFIASYANTVMQLIFTQGVLYGTGWVFCYVPFLIMMNDWWIQRRGLIYGIVYGSSGFGGFILPFIMEAALARFGFRTTLRLSAIGLAAFTGPSMLLIRQYPSRSRTSLKVVPKPDLIRDLRNALRNRIFVLFAIAAFLQGLSFYIPRFFIPSFAHSIPLSPDAGATCLALWSLAQVVGQLSLGALADKVSIFVPATLSTLASSLSALLIWGPAHSFWPLAAFSTVFGLFAPAYSVMWSQTTRILGSTKEEATMMFAILSLGRGVGNELAGPISAALLGSEVNIAEYGLGKYRGNVVFVVIAMGVASFTWVGWFWRDLMQKSNHYEEVKMDEGLLGLEQELDPLSAFELSDNEDEDEALEVKHN